MVENATALDRDLPWKFGRFSFYCDYYIWLSVATPSYINFKPGGHEAD
jgi:hypothetical protein